MGKARFRVVGRLDKASALQEGTVIIDREAGILEVRPLRKRRVYRLPLGTVADLVCQLCLKAEMRERVRAKKRRRRVKRGKL